jgi:hypothetical protein
LNIGCIGFGAGGTAALMMAGAITASVDALVIADAQPHLVGERISSIAAPTLLLATAAPDLNQRMSEIAYARLHCEKALQILPADETLAAHRTASVAADWFARYLSHGVHLRENQMEFQR